MADKERNALIPLPSGGLENIGSGPKSILSGMVSDALALARVWEKSLAAVRFRIGDYEFRDPDYRQILIWAKALGIAPEVFVSRVDRPFDVDSGILIEFKVEDGKIISMRWDFDIFPISSFQWVDGLIIKTLAFNGLASAEISLHFPLLDWLDCSYIGLTELDISNLPKLRSLLCSGNKISELDLSFNHELKGLSCGNNRLAKLDLSNNLKINNLSCDNNQFIELDLSNTHNLKYLSCNNNQLAKLNLSNIHELDYLNCSNNKITKLDLSNAPDLNYFLCTRNQLVDLDLSNVPELTELRCRNNLLVELDIRCLEKLVEFSCDPSVSIKKLPTQNF